MDSLIRTTQLLGVTSSLILSGMNLGASLLTLPILYTRHPSVSTPVFHELYTRGALSLVPSGMFSAACSTFTAYLLPEQRKLWAIAAIATASQTPWTMLVMKNTNDRLNAIAGDKMEQQKADKQEVVGLLKSWTWMNIGRGLLALGGGLAGLLAVMDQFI
ncbi:MAG: hypothetical protein L6R42_001316 [Xanthoria sp. 1 TBL-2021]|nr:MAG: hypothetical protein L6R42_001316 [Xanthoria sp. 1 TBL-2021]